MHWETVEFIEDRGDVLPELNVGEERLQSFEPFGAYGGRLS
jgi:hypothetical protein